MAMLSLSKRIQKTVFDSLPKLTNPHLLQLRYARTDGARPSPPPHNRRKSKFSPANLLNKADREKSEWWAVDGEMHEVGENVPPRERFVIPRENLPNKRRKQLREQFMRRTRLVLKETEHEPWCKRYMELFNELRENWERLYWDEGFSKKLARDHANYESAEDDDEDFNPNRRRPNRPEQFMNHPEQFMNHPEQYMNRSIQFRDQGTGRNREGETWQKSPPIRRDPWQNGSQVRDKFEYDREQRMRDKDREGETWQKSPPIRRDPWQNGSQVRDKFEYDREQRMRDKAFAPMSGRDEPMQDDFSSWNQPFSPQRYISESASD